MASGVLFLFEENVLAYSNRRAEALRHVIRGGSPRTFDVLNRQWIVGRKGEIYNYVYFDPQRSRAERVLGVQVRPEGLAPAEPGVLQDGGASAGHATGLEQTVVWQARDGWVREFDRQVEERAYRPVERADVFARAAAVLHDRAARTPTG